MRLGTLAHGSKPTCLGQGIITERMMHNNAAGRENESIRVHGDLNRHGSVMNS